MAVLTQGPPARRLELSGQRGAYPVHVQQQRFRAGWDRQALLSRSRATQTLQPIAPTLERIGRQFDGATIRTCKHRLPVHGNAVHPGFSERSQHSPRPAFLPTQRAEDLDALETVGSEKIMLIGVSRDPVGRVRRVSPEAVLLARCA